MNVVLDRDINVILYRDINEYYEEWNKNYKLTNDQKISLYKLFNKMLLNNYNVCMLLFVNKDLNKYIKKTLKDNTKDLDHMTSEDIHTLIITIKKSTKLTSQYLKNIEQIYTINEINEIIKKFGTKYNRRTIKNYSDLRELDLVTLIYENPDINFEKALTKIPKTNEYIIDYTKKYEYGYQQYSKKNDTEFCNKLFYIKFYDMLVIDFDSNNIKELHKVLDKVSNNMLFRIYKTTNGYHAILISHPINHSTDQHIELSLLLKSDRRYIIFSKYNGYNIRLSKKHKEETYKYEFIEEYGNGTPSIQLQHLIKILEEYTNKVHI